MSFSQEVKDFLTGYTTVRESSQKDRSLDISQQNADVDKSYKESSLDIDRQKLDLQKQAQGLRNKLAMAANSRADAASKRAASNAELKAIGALGTDPAGNVDTGADAEPGYDDSTIDSYINADAGGYARGGLVQTAAQGAMVGAVPTDDEEAIIQRKVRAAQGTPAAAVPAAPVTPASNPPAAAPTAAIPDKPAVVPEGAPVPRPRSDRPKTDASSGIFAKAGEATELAMRSLKEDSATSGQPEEALPTGSITKSEFNPATNKGAATPEEIKAIDAKIGGSFDGYTKGAARLAYAYNYFMENGQIEKAANVAKRILLFDKQAAQTRGYLAQKALEQGDTAAATKLISDAYNENIPDGQQLKTALNPDGSVSFSVMKDGKVVQEGKANTEQLWAMAAKVKDGSEFLHRMATLAQTYSPMGSNGAFGKAQTAFVESNADFLALQEKYAKGSEAEKRAMYDDLKKADKTRRDAWRQAQEVGSKYVKGKNEADVFKTVNDSLKAAVSAYGNTGAPAAPAAAPDGDATELGNRYAAYNQQLSQLKDKLDEISDPNNPEYQALMARAQPIMAARDQVKAQFEKVAGQSMPGKNEVDVATGTAEALKTVGGAPAAIPIDTTSKGWKVPGGTLPQTAADMEKERALQQRIARGEQVAFKPLSDSDVSKVVNAVVQNGINQDIVIGKLIRDGYDPSAVKDALSKQGIKINIDITGLGPETK